MIPNRFPKNPNGIAIISDLPSVQELSLEALDSGADGKLLYKLLNSVNVQLKDCFRGTIYSPGSPERKALYQIPKDEVWKKSLTQLYTDLIKYQPNIIVSLGRDALQVLTRYNLSSLEQWRGSLLEYTIPDTDYSCKLLPTFDPQILLGSSHNMVPVAQVDFDRARRYSNNTKIPTYPWEFHINTPHDEVMDVLKHVNLQPKAAFDIENNKQQEITCIGFSWDCNKAICVRLDPDVNPKQLTERWNVITEILQNQNCKKIAHNTLYDSLILKHHYGIDIKNNYLDTMIAFHNCFPGYRKSLSFATSFLTDYPHWKFLNQKDDGEAIWDKKPNEDFWKYNCLDTAVTYEIALLLERCMEELGVKDLTMIDMRLIELSLDMTLRGIRIDDVRMKARHKEVKKQIDQKQLELNEALGIELNVKSPKQISEYVYKKLNLPKKYGTGGGLTTGSKTLLELARQHKKYDLIKILEVRNMRTLSSFYKLDVRQNLLNSTIRIHPSFKVGGTETGRWSSSASPLGGRNLQNIPEEARDIYIADKDMTLIGWDKAQAEARVVAYKSYIETGNTSYKTLVEEGIKTHVWFGRILAENKVFKCHPDEITKESPEYLIAKKSIHAFSYGMGPLLFVKTLMDETMGEVNISMKMAKEIKELLHSHLSAIPHYQKVVKQEVMRTRRIVSAFGRVTTYPGFLDTRTFGTAYSAYPQGTVADDVNLSILNTTNALPELQPLLQVHDSGMWQCPIDRVQEVLPKMFEIAQQPIKIKNFTGTKEIEIIVPIEMKVGERWSDMKEITLEEVTPRTNPNTA